MNWKWQLIVFFWAVRPGWLVTFCNCAEWMAVMVAGEEGASTATTKRRGNGHNCRRRGARCYGRDEPIERGALGTQSARRRYGDDVPGGKSFLHNLCGRSFLSHVFARRDATLFPENVYECMADHRRQYSPIWSGSHSGWTAIRPRRTPCRDWLWLCLRKDSTH